MAIDHDSMDEVRPYEKVMGFIDGGYLRELCKENCGNDNINSENLWALLLRSFNYYHINPFLANLIRIYYYDAIVEEGQDYEKQKKYFEVIPEQYPYTVRLGKLVKSSNKGYKQKGVDILMAVDAITKAYENHYDVGMFLIGDGDFKPMIEAVKDAGKKTMGIYYPANTSQDLLRTFDMRVALGKGALEICVKKQ
jgi:uncharacterized LabA/DUF88 family protein